MIVTAFRMVLHMVGASVPVEVGHWFVVPNRVTGLLAPEQDGTHPMLVGSAWPGPRISLLPRSASVAEGRPHPAHCGRCESASCCLDRPGWITPDVESVDETHVTEYSCHEPDDDVIDWAMGVGSGRQSGGRRRL